MGSHLRYRASNNRPAMHHWPLLPHRQPCRHRERHPENLTEQRLQPHDAGEGDAVEEALHLWDAGAGRDGFEVDH